MNLSDAADRICQDYLNRTDTEVRAAVLKEIQLAIDFYASERFGFNEKEVPLTLTLTSVYSLEAIARAASESSEIIIEGPNPAYGLLLDNTQLTLSSGLYYANIIDIDKFVVTHSTTRDYDLDEVPFERMVRMRNAPQISGNPSYFSVFNRKVYLNATPTGTMSAVLYAHVEFLPLDESNNATNPWLTDALELILARAARMTAMKRLHDTELAMAYAQLEQEALSAVRRRAHKDTSSGQLSASW